MNDKYLIIHGEKITAKEVKKDLDLSWEEFMESVNRLCEKGLLKKVGYKRYIKVDRRKQNE